MTQEELFEKYLQAIEAKDYDTVWSVSKEMEKQDPSSFKATINAPQIAIASPKTQTDEILAQIQTNIGDNFAWIDKNAQDMDSADKSSWKAYASTEAALALDSIVNFHQQKSAQCLNLLDTLSDNAQKLEKESLFERDYNGKYLTSSLMSAYADCEQDTARTILSIDKINALRAHTDPDLQDYFDNKQRKGFITYYDSLQDLMYNASFKDFKGSQAIAKHILNTVQTPSNPEGAESYLNLLSNVVLQNPECTSKALVKMNGTFNKFNSSEAVQKKALSCIEKLQTHASKFDDYELSSLSSLQARFSNTIKAQTVLRSRGQSSWRDDDFEPIQEMEMDYSKKKLYEYDIDDFEIGR